MDLIQTAKLGLFTRVEHNLIRKNFRNILTYRQKKEPKSVSKLKASVSFTLFIKKHGTGQKKPRHSDRTLQRVGYSGSVQKRFSPFLRVALSNKSASSAHSQYPAVHARKYYTITVSISVCADTVLLSLIL